MDGKWKTLGPGESAHVPPNTPHSWRPVGEDVRILGVARPGARFEENWRQFMGMAQDGKLGPNGDHLPFLQAMAMIHEFPDVMALAGPPIFLQHALAAVFGAHRPTPRLPGQVSGVPGARAHRDRATRAAARVDERRSAIVRLILTSALTTELKMLIV